MARIPVTILHRRGALARTKRWIFDRFGPRAEAGYHGVTNRLSAWIYSTWRSNLPRSIEIETISLCNGGCTFCPVNVRDDPRPTESMSMDLVERIARELGEAGYRGDIALFSNNEPLLDGRIVEIVRFLRGRIHGAWLYVYTNGIRLSEELWTSLFAAGLDEMVINNYNDALELNRPVGRLLAAIELRDDELARRAAARTRVLVRMETEVLMNRAGTAPNKVDSEEYRSYGRASCGLPFQQMVIRPSGEVSLCCQDALGAVTLGDLRLDSIRSIWNGEPYARIRATLQQVGRRGLPLCSRCDAYILSPDLLRRMLQGPGPRRWARASPGRAVRSGL